MTTNFDSKSATVIINNCENRKLDRRSNSNYEGRGLANTQLRDFESVNYFLSLYIYIQYITYSQHNKMSVDAR